MYAISVLNLLEEKAYDDAWKLAQESLLKLEDKIQNKDYSGYSPASADIDIEFDIVSIFRHMAEICYKEKKFNDAYTYYLVATKVSEEGSQWIERREQIKKKATLHNKAKISAKKIIIPWKILIKKLVKDFEPGMAFHSIGKNDNESSLNMKKRKLNNQKIDTKLNHDGSLNCPVCGRNMGQPKTKGIIFKKKYFLCSSCNTKATIS